MRLTLAIAFLTVSVMAQAPKVEPPRTLIGVMSANTITIMGRDGITYKLKEAKVVDGRLHFTGSLTRTGVSKATDAQLVGTTARAGNPWPSPRQQRRVRKPTDGQAADVNEQTQSLYTARDTGLGCEVVFLKLPVANRAMQLGVTLVPIDNPTGQEINSQVCRVVRALHAGQKGEVDSHLAALNQLLKSRASQ